LWWSLQMTEMSSSESANARPKNSFWKRSTFGKFLSKLFEASRLFTIWKFCTAIWKAPTFFFTKTAPLSLGTWTFLKLPKRDCFTPRLELPIMQVLKCGKISLMTWNLTFGRLAVWFTRCVHLSHLSELMTWMVFSKECSRDNTPLFPVITALTCARLSRTYSRSNLLPDLIRNKSSICQSSKNVLKSTLARKMEAHRLLWRKEVLTLNCCEQSG